MSNQTQFMYKGAIIEEGEYFKYDWHHPNYYDVDYENGVPVIYGGGSSDSIEDIKIEIDEFLEENE